MSFDTPTQQAPIIYQITVQGHLGSDWSPRLAGMSITHSEKNAICLSTLTGRVIDQAELNGILNTLFNQRMSVVSVSRLPK